MKNIVAAVLASMLSLSLTGCSVFQTLEGQTEDKPNEYTNVYELSSGKAIEQQILEKKAKIRYISLRTLNQAKKNLNIRSIKTREGWQWHLPE